jgi:hypothetical protein
MSSCPWVAVISQLVSANAKAEDTVNASLSSCVRCHQNQSTPYEIVAFDLEAEIRFP